MSRKKNMIIVEGVIGAGKTTFVKALIKAHPSATPFFEPVNTNPYLTKFYNNMARWALEMQYWLLTNRFKMHQEAIKLEWAQGTPTIFDRSIYGDSPFASLLHSYGMIDELGYKSYCQHKECMESFLLVPQEVIFLDTPINICYDWIHKDRARKCENGITKKYLVDLRYELLKVMDNLSKKTTVTKIIWGPDKNIDDAKLTWKGFYQQK